MIRNPAYVGRWEWGKRSNKRGPNDHVPGYCPPIVSEETFTKAGEVLKGNQLFSSRDTHRTYLLRGIIKCGLCGKTFCGSYSRVGPNRSRERVYYRCNGKTQWRKLGVTECPSLTLDGATIQDVVWEDIEQFCKNPEVAISQLRAQKKPVDNDLGDRIRTIEDQISELKHQEMNLIKIAASSKEVDPEALDKVLGENRRSLEALISYRAMLEAEKLRSTNLEDDLINVAKRLQKLGEQIEHASF